MKSKVAISITLTFRDKNMDMHEENYIDVSHFLLTYFLNPDALILHRTYDIKFNSMITMRQSHETNRENL